MMWTPADLAILVPMLGRAHTIAPLMESIRDTVPDALTVFVCTVGDGDVIDTAEATGATVVQMAPRVRGDYAAKINHGYRLTRAPLLFTGACDLRFHPDWFNAAVAQLGDGIGVVGTNDLTNPRTVATHSTHSLVTRDYADRGLIDGRPGLLCVDYLHEMCDDELVGTARHRGAYAHATDSHVEHMHPMAGKAPWDASYRAMKARMRTDRTLYRKRQRLWT